MASKREAVTQAFVAALDGAGKPAGLTVHRSRTRPIDRDDLPAQLVYLDAETAPDSYATPAMDRELTLVVESRASGNPPDAALDPLLSWAVRALMADITLGGVALRVDEIGTQWAAGEADKIYGAAEQRFRVIYRTRGDDPDLGA